MFCKNALHLKPKRATHCVMNGVLGLGRINQSDGFIISAFIDEVFEKSKVIWSRHK